MPFTPTVGKEAFLKGPAYLVRTDFAAQVWGEKEICFPNTIPITHGSADLPVGTLCSRPHQSSSGNIGDGSSAGALSGV
jgi:hypothetical protein